MSQVLDPTVSKDALDAFRRIAMVEICRWCFSRFMKTSLTPDICPHCHEAQ